MIAGNRCGEDKKEVENARWTLGWQDEPCETGGEGGAEPLFETPDHTDYFLATDVKIWVSIDFRSINILHFREWCLFQCKFYTPLTLFYCVQRNFGLCLSVIRPFFNQSDKISLLGRKASLP
jgi:hypothetical protein